MSIVQQAIDVRVPLHAAYEHLARFEEYPQFMTGVQEVQKLSDDRVHWVMDTGDGAATEFDARITECLPDERVSWQATTGPAMCETITLTATSDSMTHIMAQVEADAAALMPSAAHAEETLSRRLKADLEGFKRMMEQHVGRTTQEAATQARHGQAAGLGSDAALAGQASGALGAGTMAAGEPMARPDMSQGITHNRGLARGDGER